MTSRGRARPVPFEEELAQIRRYEDFSTIGKASLLLIMVLHAGSIAKQSKSRLGKRRHRWEIPVVVIPQPDNEWPLLARLVEDDLWDNSDLDRGFPCR